MAKTQIEEFSKALEILNESNVLIVIGYNFNCDDNHINSLLHTYLHEKCSHTNQRLKEILFFDYVIDEKTAPTQEERLNELYDRLRIPQNNRKDSLSKVKLRIVQIGPNKEKSIFKNEIERYLET